MWVKLTSMIRPYLRSRVMDHTNEAVLHNNLKEPVPRKVYDAVIRCSSPDILASFLAALEKSHAAKNKVSTLKTTQ